MRDLEFYKMQKAGKKVLCDIANKLDKIGLYSLADRVDRLLQFGQPMTTPTTEYSTPGQPFSKLDNFTLGLPITERKCPVCGKEKRLGEELVCEPCRELLKKV